MLLLLQPIHGGEILTVEWAQEASRGISGCIQCAQSQLEEARLTLSSNGKAIIACVEKLKGLIRQHHKLVSKVRPLLKTLTKVHHLLSHLFPFAFAQLKNRSSYLAGKWRTAEGESIIICQQVQELLTAFGFPSQTDFQQRHWDCISSKLLGRSGSSCTSSWLVLSPCLLSIWNICLRELQFMQVESMMAC